MCKLNPRPAQKKVFLLTTAWLNKHKNKNNRKQTTCFPTQMVRIYHLHRRPPPNLQHARPHTIALAPRPGLGPSPAAAHLHLCARRSGQGLPSCRGLSLSRRRGRNSWISTGLLRARRVKEEVTHPTSVGEPDGFSACECSQMFLFGGEATPQANIDSRQSKTMQNREFRMFR